jgi:hypothetical protein
MTESVATFLLVLSAWLVLFPQGDGGRRGWGIVLAAATGLSLGMLCLVRPAFQIVVPFFASAAVVRSGVSPSTGPRRKRVAGVGLTLIASFLAITGPWLVSNAERGIIGFSGANSGFFWIGMSHNGLLIDDPAVPPVVRDSYNALVRPHAEWDGATHEFLHAIGAWDSPATISMLGRWARRSVRASPVGYGRAALRSLGHQLDIFGGADRLMANELAWMMYRAGERESALRANGGAGALNFNAGGDAPGISTRFAMPAARGPWARYLRWSAVHGPGNGTGVVRALMAAVAAVAVVLGIRRRRWPLALAFLGTFAYVGVHAAVLLFNSRFSAPCWAVWYVAPAAVLGLVQWRRGNADSQHLPAGLAGEHSLVEVRLADHA